MGRAAQLLRVVLVHPAPQKHEDVLVVRGSLLEAKLRANSEFGFRPTSPASVWITDAGGDPLSWRRHHSVTWEDME